LEKNLIGTQNVTNHQVENAAIAPVRRQKYQLADNLTLEAPVISAATLFAFFVLC